MRLVSGRSGIFAAIWYAFGTVGPRARQWRGATHFAPTSHPQRPECLEVCKLSDKPADSHCGNFPSFCGALVTQVLILEFTWQVAELLKQNSSAVLLRCPFVQAEAKLERVIDNLSAIHFRAPVHSLPEASAHWGLAQSPREADRHGYLEVHERTYCKAVLNAWVY